MKFLSSIAFALMLLNLTSPAANAGLLNGAVKGIGKGTRAVVGCADRGVKGIGKGAKTVVGGTGKAAKSTAGGMGKATKTAL